MFFIWHISSYKETLCWCQSLNLILQMIYWCEF